MNRKNFYKKLAEISLGPPTEYPNKDKRKRKGICRQCGNTSDFVCSKCKHIKQYKE